MTGPNQQEVSLTDVSGLISRVTGLPPEFAEVARLTGQLHGTINNDPALRTAAMNGGLESFIWSRIPQDLVEKMDPARRAEAERRRVAQGANLTGSDFANATGGMGRLAALGVRNALREGAISNDAQRSGQGDAAARASGSTDLRGITQGNYEGTAFDRSGLGFAAFDTMRKEGFNGKQIIAAVDTNKTLGLDANNNPVATARLQRDVPAAIPGLFKTRDNWKGVFELEKAEKEARERGDVAAAAQLKNQVDQARRQADEHDKQEQDRVRQTKPERVPDLIDRQQQIKKAAEATPRT